MPASLFINRIAICFWLAVLVAFAFIDLSFITNKLTVDSDVIMEMREGVGEDVGNSYRNTAFFFSMIPDALIIPVVLIISAFALIIFMKDLRRSPSILTAMYITLPGMLLFLPRPQKETIVILLTIIVYKVFCSDYKEWKKIALFVALYGAYAYLFRQYYFLIMAAFFFVYFWGKMSLAPRLSMSVFVIIVIMLLPEKFFMSTQGARDVVNYALGATRYVRTAFVNPLTPDNGLNFIVNYVYSVFRLNAPIFFTFSYKEIFHMVAIFLVGKMVWSGLRVKGDKSIKLFAQLVLAHAIALMIFEPDLGSYLRHLTSVFIYLTPMLLMSDRNKKLI